MRSNSLQFLLLAASLVCGGIAYAGPLDSVKDKASGSNVTKSGALDAPVTVNGDTVEYSTDQKKVVASGNVLIEYKGASLSCDKISVDMATKDAVAEGSVVIKDEKQGIMSGERVLYNLGNKTGTVLDGDFMSPPQYGKAKEITKVSETEFVAKKGYVTTCDMDKPHYRISSKRITIFPDDKIQTQKDVFYIGKCPVAYLPFYNHSLKEPLMHVQLMPGHSSDWGYFLLSAWRYYVNDDFAGRIYLDYRNDLGVGSGFGLNYRTDDYGRGDFKYYYTQERSREYLEEQPAEFERSLIRWRHKWIIDEQTDIISEYYKIDDAKRAIYGTEFNVLKDYFYREYEKDSQPRSYSQLHHNFTDSSMDVLVQARVNNWYDTGFVEKLPEVSYSMPVYQLGDSRFYFDNATTIANLNKKNSTSTVFTPNTHVNRFDTTNKVSMPMKISFLSVSPFTGTRETAYGDDLSNDARLRTIFLTGADMSTKFFRLFDVKTDSYGLNINGLRHVITPTIGYAYDHAPTITASKLRQIDEVDAITYSNNRAVLGLSNTLQTKRDKKTVDLASFMISNTYYFKPKSGPGSYMGDYLFDLELRPYTWLSAISDATYDHRNRYFTYVNYDISCNIAAERTFSVGHRYERRESSEITAGSDWRLTPKWKFGFYERFQVRDTASVKSGLRYQEYRISRDLHCWIMDVAYSAEKDHGNTIWLIFKLKAFPGTQFQFDQSYHQPKPGSSTYYSN
ncbi:MAG: LPS assembly protein LptD [Candidatus Omnitrophota bacterium]